MDRILIIDDEEDLLISLRGLLEKQGFSTAILARPETAFNMIDVWKPDIILLDIKLIEMDGRDICLQLKSNSRTKRMKIILFSGEVIKKEDYIEYGADDFIEKPVNFSGLLKKIKSHLTAKVE
jgi:DNA-binding response OmpR family regulator